MLTNEESINSLEQIAMRGSSFAMMALRYMYSSHRRANMPVREEDKFMTDVLSSYRNGVYHPENAQAVNDFIGELTGGKITEKQPFVFLGNKSDLSAFWQVTELERRTLTKTIPDKRVVVPRKMIEDIPDETIRKNTLAAFAKAQADKLVYFDGTAYGITEAGKKHISTSSFAIGRLEAEYKFFTGAEEGLKASAADAEKEGKVASRLKELGVDEKSQFPGYRRVTINRDSLSAEKSGENWVSYVPGTGRRQSVVLPGKDVIELDDKTIVAFIDVNKKYNGIGDKKILPGNELLLKFDDRTKEQKRHPTVEAIRKSAEDVVVTKKTPVRTAAVDENYITAKLKEMGVDTDNYSGYERVVIDGSTAAHYSDDYWHISVPGKADQTILFNNKHIYQIDDNIFVAFINPLKMYPDVSNSNVYYGGDIIADFAAVTKAAAASELHVGDIVFAPDHFSESLELNKYTVDRLLVDADGQNLYYLKGGDLPDQILPEDSLGKFMFTDRTAGEQYVQAHREEVYNYADKLLAKTMGEEFENKPVSTVYYDITVKTEDIVSTEGDVYRVKIPGSQVEQAIIPASNVTAEEGKINIALQGNKQYRVISGSYGYNVSGEGLAKLTGVNVKAVKRVAVEGVKKGAVAVTSGSVNATIAAAPVPETITMGAKAVYAAAAQTMTTILGETTQKAGSALKLTQSIGKEE